MSMDDWDLAEDFRREVEAMTERAKKPLPREARLARRWRKAKQIDGHHDAVIAHQKGRVVLPLAIVRFLVGPNKL